MQSIITMDYGSGGLRTAELIDEILLPAFGNAALNDLGDGAVLPDLGGKPGIFHRQFCGYPLEISRAGTSASWLYAAPSTTCAWPGANRCI